MVQEVSPIQSAGLVFYCCRTWVNFFFFNDPAPTEFYSLPLHDPLPISWASLCSRAVNVPWINDSACGPIPAAKAPCNPRAPPGGFGEGEKPQSADAIVKPAIPITY